VGEARLWEASALATAKREAEAEVAAVVASAKAKAQRQMRAESEAAAAEARAAADRSAAADRKEAAAARAAKRKKAAADDAQKAKAADAPSLTLRGAGGGGNGGGGGVGGGKPKGVAVYLLTWHEDNFFGYYTDLLTSIRCLYKFFLKPYGYGVVVFVYGNMPAAKKTELRARLPAGVDITIKSITFDYPRKIAADVDGYMNKHCVVTKPNGKTYHAWPEKKCGCGCGGPICWHLNYLHMNRFFTYGQWKLWRDDAELRQYEWYMRVDVDLFLQKQVPFDPFARMAQKGCVFMTGTSAFEAEGCYEGQHAATLKFAAEHGNEVGGAALYPENVKKLKPSENYWGGWNMGHINTFKSAAHLAYADYINEDGRIYTMRWNDQVHFAQAIALLTKDNGVCKEPEMFGEGTTSTDGLGSHQFVHMHGGGDAKGVIDKCMLD